MPDHVHMCISIPPKYAVSNVMGVHQGEERNCDSEALRRTKKEFYWRGFLGRGYFVSTVWLDEGVARTYIRNQEHVDERYDQMKLDV